jgi:RHS repeat-associated protein
VPGGNKGEGNVTNGLFHFGARYYDPTTGRWTQQDPLGHLGSTRQGDRYLYVGEDPINLSDPSGLCFILSCGEYHELESGAENINSAFQGYLENTKCYVNEIEGGGQCSSAPPGEPGNPIGPLPNPYPEP